MDDLKISNVEKNVIEGIIKDLNKKFGKEIPLMTTRGNVLEYLGSTDQRKVKMLMFDYIKKLMVELPAGMEGTVKAPAVIHLFMTNKEFDKLPEEKAQFFRHELAKQLYLCKRTRQDIQTKVAFLFT